MRLLRASGWRGSILVTPLILRRSAGPSRRTWAVFSALTCILTLGGCGSKQYAPPTLPTAKQSIKIVDDNTLRIKQGHITDENITAALNDTPPHLLGTALQIENKTNKPVILEIERTNVTTYDTEDLALMFSKIALQDPRMQELTIGHTISQGLTIGITSGICATWAYCIFKELKDAAIHGRELSGMRIPNNNWVIGIAAVLATIPIARIGSYVYKAISAEKTNIIESEEERLIDQFRLMFTPITLSFDDSIEIAPHSSMQQIVFYDSRPVESDMTNQHQLVLSYLSDGKKTLVPLEI